MELSSSKNPYGSKTTPTYFLLLIKLSSSKNPYGSKTSNWFYHIIEILTTIYNMTLSYWSSLYVPYYSNPLNIH